MLLTITTTHRPATDLGYLLHKNPDRVQTFDQTFGKVHVFYPEATAERCTVAVLLDVDPVGMVRDRKGPAGEGGLLEQYVNDRPYVASSFLSVALSQVFGTALGGRSKDRQALAETPLDFVARLPVVPCRGGEEMLRRLFEPLGYEVTAQRHPLDEHFPEWGESRYFRVELKSRCRLQALLSHLYVLVPVLDDDKHYWVGEDEIEKLLRHGEQWLKAHPERELITRRYLKHRSSLANLALARLTEGETIEADISSGEEELEKPLSLNEQRLAAVVDVLKQCGAKRVLDLGCGEGQLLRRLLTDPDFDEIVGIDVSSRALEIAARRLNLDRLSDRQRERVKLWHGSLTYRDRRLQGFDAAAVVEVIEHLDPPRLAAFTRSVFGAARSRTVVVTTPNAEYNVTFAGLAPGGFRHPDHRFEWTRGQFASWAAETAAAYGYRVEHRPIGPIDAALGPPTQMAVFTAEGG